jgi:hypothetical protein
MRRVGGERLAIRGHMKRVLGSLVVAGCLAVVTPASAATILQFTEAGPFNTPFVFTENSAKTATTITASKAVDVVFDPSFCLVATCGGATDGIYTLAFNATSSGAASLSAGAITEPSTDRSRLRTDRLTCYRWSSQTCCGQTGPV